MADLKLAIHDPRSPHRPGYTYLRLVQIDDREVMLAVVDDAGRTVLDPDSDKHGGTLLTVSTTGFLALSPALMPALGFQLDGAGRIALDPYCESTTAQHAQRFGGRRAAFRSIEGDQK